MKTLIAAILALAGATPAAAAWQEASSKHFIVYSDDSPQRVAEYATKLERFDKALRVTRSTPDYPISPMARVTVFIVPNVEAVQKLYGGKRSVVGFYIPRAAQTVAFVPRTSDDDLNSLVVLLHEYSHHFMYSNYGRAAYPAWLVEGFAEFNSTAIFNKDGSVLFGAAANHRADGMLDDDVVPLSTLLTAAPDDLKGVDAISIFYSRAWLLMHYMTMDSGRRAKLADYFTALNRGAPAAKAAALLGDPRKLDGQLNAYVNQSQLNGYTVPAARLAIDPVQVRAVPAAQAAVMSAWIASSRGVNAGTAPRVAELARRLAAPYAADAAAQNALAEAEFDAGRLAEAEQAADRALAADPKSIHALLYKGLARQAAAVASGATDPATWSEVRSWFVKANRLDPEYAYPLMLFYRAYLRAGQSPPANAQQGLLYAHRLAPFDLNLGMEAARILLNQNKPDEAKIVLYPIAYNPHGGGLSDTAGKVIAAIDRDGATAGLKVMNGKPDDADESEGTDTSGSR